VSVKEERQIGIILSLKIYELLNILHHNVERWEMSARAAGSAMSAQVEAKEGIARVIEGFAYMCITTGVFAKPMNKADDSFGFSLRLPTLHIKRDVVVHISF
jgi:hypothetical protein